MRQSVELQRSSIYCAMRHKVNWLLVIKIGTSQGGALLMVVLLTEWKLINVERLHFKDDQCIRHRGLNEYQEGKM